MRSLFYIVADCLSLVSYIHLQGNCLSLVNIFSFWVQSCNFLKTFVSLPAAFYFDYFTRTKQSEGSDQPQPDPRRVHISHVHITVCEASLCLNKLVVHFKDGTFFSLCPFLISSCFVLFIFAAVVQTRSLQLGLPVSWVESVKTVDTRFVDELSCNF